MLGEYLKYGLLLPTDQWTQGQERPGQLHFTVPMQLLLTPYFLRHCFEFAESF